ncbi:MAG: terpene cyclase/mutase family protein [Acidobacteria bacterium]|nr:terpene cyclase/mutase family protein [Acidobacteriota bacterium]
MNASKIVTLGLALSLAAASAAGATTAPRLPRRLVDDPRAASREESAISGDAQATSSATGQAIPRALARLGAIQNAGGSWGATFEYPDTSTVVDALGRAQLPGDPFRRGFGWLTGHAPADNDELSRQLVALERVTSLDLGAPLDTLLAARNVASTNTSAPNYPEGGWGLAAGYETDSLTTSLALLALEGGGRKAGIAAVNEALAGGTTRTHTWTIASSATKARIQITVSGSTVRLRMKQGTPPTGADPYFSLPSPGTYLIVFPDSGLPFTPGTNYITIESPNPPASAATYSFTASYQTPTFDTRAFAEALEYLRQSKNGDGGWGIQRGSPTSLYTTAHVLLALLRYRDYDLDAELAAGIAYLQGQQLPGGAFGTGGVSYLTAIAALDLLEYQPCPFSAAAESAITALQSMQNPDGSWAEEPYDTGLALRALWEYDRDGDGVLADGDCSGVAGDHLCTVGMTTGCDDDCVDYFNPTQGAVVFGQTVSGQDKDTFTWPSPVDVTYVKGDLASVRTYGVIAGGAVSYATSLSTFGDVPAVKKGYYYLFRPAGNCGKTSWQSTLGAEPGRDTASLGQITIAITSPTNGAVLTASPAAVTGTVTGAEPINVTVNSVAASESAGAFTASVPLVRGANTLTAVGVDAAGFMGTSAAIGLTLVDYSIAKGGVVTGTRIFTAASSTLDQVAFYTESQMGVPAGVTYSTTSVSRISATQMQIGFQINVSASAVTGIYFFQVTYGLLDAALNPLGPLTGNVFDFEIRVTP